MIDKYIKFFVMATLAVSIYIIISSAIDMKKLTKYKIITPERSYNVKDYREEGLNCISFTDINGNEVKVCGYYEIIKKN